MSLKKIGHIVAASALLAGWSSAPQALLIDSFDIEALAAVTGPAPDTDNAFTNAGMGMIGDRNLFVEKTAGGMGFVNAAVAEVTGGLLGMSNGPETNSIISSTWNFGATDLTEGGTASGFFLSLPNPIDNDLTVAFSINGGPALSRLFPDGSTGDDFFFPFADFANSGAAAAATEIAVTFSNGVAWDAQIDFIETRSDVPVPAPASLSLLGLALCVLGWMRRKPVV
ncbi:MAG: PEP-CTERM sorting domain-containing protein [Pseudomonadota bacterium]